MTNSVQSVISINVSRRLIQFSAVIFTLFFIQFDAFTQKYYSFEYEGRQREYVVYLPQDFQPNLPVVFGFHGYRQGSNFISYSLLHEVADTAGFITIYPQSNPYWNTGLLYPGYPTIDTTVNDVGFISALIDTLHAHYAIDIRRIYSCGFSHGGGMTNVLSGELSNRFAAVASVAGLYNDNSALRYDPVRPFPILHIHGTEDIIETWDGSKANLWSVDSTINYKLEKNGCSLPGDTVLLPDLDKTDGCTVEKISYTNCSGEGQLIFYKIQGGGHSWPSSAYTFPNEGNKNKDINANVEILNFFKKFENPLVYIPDTAFLYALIDEGVDTNGDSLISYAEAQGIASLDVIDRGISDMTGIEAFVNLDSLWCQTNIFTNLDMSSNTVLRFLNCGGYRLLIRNIEELDVTNNHTLETLNCQNTDLTSLDLSNNTRLKHLDCSYNALVDLDLSNNTELESLRWDYCHLPSLDISHNPNLKYIGLKGTHALNQICVWTVPFPPYEVLIDTIGSPNAYFTTECGNNIVSIPDTAFLYALIEEGVDTNGDSLISYDEAEQVTELELTKGLDYSDWGITDLKGIEAIVNLKSLECGYNPISNLDLSSNSALEVLALGRIGPCNFSVHRPIVDNLDLSLNPRIRELYCRSNEINYINVSACDSLQILVCPGNNLTTLDISKNSILHYLNCNSNNLTAIDLSNNPKLNWLWCASNKLTALSVRNNPELQVLDCGNESMDVFWQNSNGMNQIQFLDLRGNSKIGSANEIYWCRGYQIRPQLSLPKMPALEIVCVWDGFKYDSIQIDTTGSPNVVFTTVCSGTVIEGNDLSGLTIYPNPTSSILTIDTDQSDHYSIEITSLNGQTIYCADLERSSQEVDLSTFQKGVYFITIRSKDFVTTRKIIKL